MPNPLLSIQPPQQAVTPRNALLYPEPQQGEVTPAQAYESVTTGVGDWVERKRQEGIANGELDPETGWATVHGITGGFGQWAGAMAGTTGGKVPLLPSGRGLKLFLRAPEGADLTALPSATPSFGFEPREHALSAVPILYGDHPTLPARSRGVEDIGKDLMDRGRGALKALGVRSGVIDTPAPDTDALLSRVMAHEAKAAVDNTPGNASNWYTGKVEDAMRVATLMHPELADDPVARMAYTGSLAVTSQGETVPRNAGLADGAYREWKETGVFPTNLQVKKQGINDNFTKLNDLLARVGPEDAVKFLNQKMTTRELESHGYKIGGENKDTEVYGSTLLGPKIGGGFYQNLNGNYDPVTMDLWFMRNWGRLTGTLAGQQNPDAFLKTRGRFEEAMAGDNQAVPKTLPGLDRRAQEIVSQHESDYKKFRADYDSGARVKSPVTLSAQAYQKGRTGLNEVPSSGGDRVWMRSVVNQAREHLGAEGHPMTNADLQAILWYPEKDLYAKLGGRDSEAINVDYATALSAIARQNGVGDGEIARALSSLGNQR